MKLNIGKLLKVIIKAAPSVIAAVTAVKTAAKEEKKR